MLAALADANGGHQVSYGEDATPERWRRSCASSSAPRAEVFPVFNGTGANVVALTSLLPRWGAVVATSTAHIHTDEGGAPEKVTGLKLFVVPTPDGKLTPELIATEAWGWGDEHRAQPLAVSITQTTELGTLYTPDEVRAIADYAHEHGMALHMDGARIWNAAAALGVPFREFTVDAGVDILSFGGTKNGLLGAEAVVVLDPDRVDGLVFLRKTTMQLVEQDAVPVARSCSRCSTAGSASPRRRTRTRWRHGCAGRSKNSPCPGLGFSQPTQANAVFAVLDNAAADRIREKVRFYDWDRAAARCAG